MTQLCISLAVWLAGSFVSVGGLQFLRTFIIAGQRRRPPTSYTATRSLGLWCALSDVHRMSSLESPHLTRVISVQLKPNTHRDATQLSGWVASAVCTEFATSWRQSRRVWTNLLTVKLSCVVSAAWTHPSAVVTQFTISCAVELFRLLTSDDVMTSLLKKLSMSIKIHVIKPLLSVVSFQIVDRIRWQSSSVNSVHTAHADATQLDSWIASASAVSIGHYTAVGCNFRCGIFVSVTVYVMSEIYV